MLGPETSASFAQLVNNYSNLVNLSVADCALGDIVGETVFSTLFNNRSLRVLLMAKNGLAVCLENIINGGIGSDREGARRFAAEPG